MKARKEAECRRKQEYKKSHAKETKEDKDKKQKEENQDRNRQGNQGMKRYVPNTNLFHTIFGRNEESWTRFWNCILDEEMGEIDFRSYTK